jgi:chemotaxis signal transduction protein
MSLQCLACEKEGYLLAVDLSEIAEVRRPEAKNGGAEIVLAGLPPDRTAPVDRVLGVLEPEAMLPVPSCLRQHRDSLRGVLRWRGSCYLRIAPELLLDFQRLNVASLAARPHREANAGAEVRDRLVTFSLACSGFPESPLVGVSARQVLEICSYEAPVSVPAAPGRLIGLASWRNSVIPMLDLSLAMGYAPADLRRATRTIILRCSTKPDALAVAVSGAISHTARLGDYRSKPVPEHAAQLAIRGAFERSGGELLVPDLDALI